VRPGPGLLRRQPGQLGGQQDVVQHGHVVEQVEELEDHADVPAPEAGQAGLAELVHPLPRHQDLAAGGTVEAGDEVEQRGLAAPGRAHHRERLAGRHRQADVVHGGGSVLVVTFGHIGELNEVIHGWTVRTWPPAARPPAGPTWPARGDRPSSPRCTGLHRAGDGAGPARGDNGRVQERGLTRRAVAFFQQDEPMAAVRPAEPGRPPGWPDWAVDTAIAVVATIAAAWAAAVQIRTGQADYAIPGPDGGRIFTPYTPLYVAYLLILGAMLTTAPLAFRRRYPAGMFCVIMVAVFATSGHSTTVTFAAVLFAAYSAILYSPYRRLALLCVFTAAVIVTAAFPNTTPPVPARFTALLVLLPTAAVAAGMRTWQRRAGDSAERLRLAQAEHEAQTRRARPAACSAARRSRPARPSSRSRAAAGPRWVSSGTCSGCWLRLKVGERK